MYGYVSFLEGTFFLPEMIGKQITMLDICQFDEGFLVPICTD